MNKPIALSRSIYDVHTISAKFDSPCPPVSTYAPYPRVDVHKILTLSGKKWAFMKTESLVQVMIFMKEI